MSHPSKRHTYAPEVVILPTAQDVDAYVSNLLLEQVKSKPSSIMTLPTGGTPLGVYKLLGAAHQEKGVDFSGITTLNLDEYWPIRKNHPSSYAFYMDENLFKRVNISEQNRQIPNGEAKDVKAEALRYETLLQQYAIDLCFITLGPGETCHIGFNERGSAIDSRVRYVPLDAETREANARFFDNPRDMPTGAITQGVADILDAKRILFVATGEHKAWGVNRSLNGEINSDAPASFLRHHPDVTVVVDKAAASLLP